MPRSKRSAKVVASSPNSSAWSVSLGHIADRVLPDCDQAATLASGGESGMRRQKF